MFGPPLPDVIGDQHCATPATSYGTQKAMIELLLSDHARRGFVDGIAIRLPTICVRPGKPNLAASGFFSSMIREPLNGKNAVLPVSTDVRHWFASPRSAIGFLLHAATLDGSRLGDRRCLTMPGVSATVAEEIEALRRFAGDGAVRRVQTGPTRRSAHRGGLAAAFEARRAHALGFSAEADFDEIIRVYVEDELGGRNARGRDAHPDSGAVAACWEVRPSPGLGGRCQASSWRRLAVISQERESRATPRSLVSCRRACCAGARRRRLPRRR